MELQTETVTSPDLPPRVDDWEFWEVAGLVFSVPPNQALDERRRLLEIDPEIQSWQLECFSNHVHLDCQRARADLHASLHEARILSDALRREYPDRRFMVVNRLGGADLSFFQVAPGSPDTDPEPRSTRPEWAYCRHCKQRQTYLPHSKPDPEFPELDWVDCAVCGNEFWLESRNRFTPVDPAGGLT